MLLIDKVESDESLYDAPERIFEDLYSKIKELDLPKDEYGFTKGSFRIRIDWEDEE